MDEHINARLDQIINRMGELTGMVTALQAQVSAMRHEFDTFRSEKHSSITPPQYWLIVWAFLAVAAIIVPILFIIGIR